MRYSYAKLSRNDTGIFRVPISGIGLANLLFPWARFMIATKNYGLKPIFPTWFQIRFGPFLRNESDKRSYCNLFHKPQNQIGGLTKLWLLTHVNRITEDNFDFPQREIDLSDTEAIIVFEGEKDYFQKLNGWNEFLYKEIRSMTDHRWLKKVDELPEIPIGVHVRRGDFGERETPLPWFIESLNEIRARIGFCVRTFIASDGKNGELKDLLTMKNVFRITTGSAIGDLLALSKAKILIGSGSSFSAWASFLGQMPTVSHPRHSLTYFKLVNSKGRYLGEFNPQFPSQSFLNQIKLILGN